MYFDLTLCLNDCNKHMTQFVAQEIKIFLKAILIIKMGWQGLNSSGSG